MADRCPLLSSFETTLQKAEALERTVELHASEPTQENPLDEDLKKDIERMRRTVAAKMKGFAKKRCYSNIEISLQMALERCSSKSNKVNGTETSDILEKDVRVSEIPEPKKDKNGSDGIRNPTIGNSACNENQPSNSNQTHLSAQPFQQMDNDEDTIKHSIVQKDEESNTRRDDKQTDEERPDSSKLHSNSTKFSEDIEGDTEMTDAFELPRTDKDSGVTDQLTNSNWDARTFSMGRKSDDVGSTKEDVETTEAKVNGRLKTGHSGDSTEDEKEGHGKDLQEISDNKSAIMLASSEDQKITAMSTKVLFPTFYKYSWKCFNLCWLMRHHSPGLHLDDKVEKGSIFDLNRFKFYTKTGKQVDYVVWPALCLYKEGPLLAKGVAQPIKDATKT